MNTDIEYKKGVLYVRVSGVLISSKINKFESEIIPLLLGLDSKYVTLNLNGVDLIDKNGINSIIKLSNIVSKNEGKLVICNINDNIKSNFDNSDIFDYCFKAKNEITSSWIFSI